jgi:hypothetical protein|tara:strand:- start:584 stop:3685 length:3102 start_codon:yes stop_codon:yes gene_type:complete
MAKKKSNGLSAKEYDKLVKKVKTNNTALTETDSILSSIATRVTGLGAEVWFEEGKKSAQQLAKEQERINELSVLIRGNQMDLNDALKSGLTSEESKVQLAEKLSKFRNLSIEELATALANSKGIDGIGKSILESAGSLEEKHQMINNLLKGKVKLNSEVNVGLATAIAGHTDIKDNVENLNGELSKNVSLLGDANAELEEGGKKSFSFSKGLLEYGKLFGKQTLDFIFEFDKAVSDAQKDSGILFKQNSRGMTDLTSKTRAFGMSVADTTGMMSELGDSLSTTNFSTLKTATEDFASIQKAIGVSSTEIVGIAGEMMKWGKSSGDVKEYFESINSSSQRLGVNTKNVVRQITQNIGKMRQFGFTEGEASLERMAVKAEFLRIDIGEIFNVAEQARTFEGALDMAAELQLAGGSFSQINPMDLLSAARKGPEELGKILTTMGSDIGGFVGKDYKFDPVDVDRLQIVAKATGLSMDAIQNSIMKTAEVGKKTADFSGLFAGLDEAEKELQKNSLSKMLDISKDGTIEIGDDFQKIFKDHKISNENLADMDKKTMEAILEAAKDESDTLEERAKMNQGLEEAFSNLVGSIMSTVAFLTPALNWVAKVLTDLSVGFSKFDETTKKWIGGTLAIGIVVSKLMAAFTGKGLVKTIGSKLGLSGEGGAGGKVKGFIKSRFSGKTKDDVSPDTKNIAKSSGGSGLKSLGQGLEGMSGKKVLSGIANLALFGPAGIVAILALPFMAGVAALGNVAGNGLLGLGVGLELFSAQPVRTGIANLALFGLAGTLATLALPFMLGVGVLGHLAAFGLTALAGGLSTFAATSGPVLTGIALIAALGLAMIPFAYALSLTAPLMGSFGDVMKGIPPIIGAIADGFVKVFSVMTLENVGSMYLMSGALGAMALSAMMFANPMTMAGLYIMTGVLGSLSIVMVSLANSLTVGAEGMEKFANATVKLKTAIADINVSKLEEIKDTASKLASASRSSAFDKLASTVQGMMGGGSGGSGSSNNNSERKIVVEIQMDGKTLQSKILKDTRQMTGR